MGDVDVAIGIGTSWYVPGHTIETFEEEIGAVADADHEIGVHGYTHEHPTDLHARSGGDHPREIHRPRRGPHRRAARGPPRELAGIQREHPELVEEDGFEYDSGLMESDFEPLYMRIDDSWESIDYDQPAETWMHPYAYGEETDVVEIPISWYRDDVPPMLFMKQPNYNYGYTSPKMVYEAHFDYLYERRGAGVYTFTIHPDVHGRPQMIPLLEEFIEYMGGHDGVEFVTLETGDGRREVRPRPLGLRERGRVRLRSVREGSSPHPR